MPRALVINGDSGILISHAHLKFANRIIIKANFLEKKIWKLNDIVAELKAENKNLGLIMLEREITQTSLNEQIGSYKSYMDSYKAETDEQFKVKQKEKRRAVKTSWLIGFVAGLIASIFI